MTVTYQNVDFVRMSDFPHLGWLCSLQAHSTDKYECARALLELVRLAGLIPISEDMDVSFVGTFHDDPAEVAWYARLACCVEGPDLPVKIVTGQLWSNHSLAGIAKNVADNTKAIAALYDPSLAKAEHVNAWRTHPVVTAIQASRNGGLPL